MDIGVITTYVVALTGLAFAIVTGFLKVQGPISTALANRRNTKAEELKRARTVEQTDLYAQVQAMSVRVGSLELWRVRAQAREQAFVDHIHAWRRAHSAAGYPYVAPTSPTQPDDIHLILPAWPPDGRDPL